MKGINKMKLRKGLTEDSQGKRVRKGNRKANKKQINAVIGKD